jgi:hypothetical protein
VGKGRSYRLIGRDLGLSGTPPRSFWSSPKTSQSSVKLETVKTSVQRK